MDDDLLKYFMQETDKKFATIQQQLEDLRAFKIEMMSSSRWISVAISGAFGLGTILLSAWLSRGGK